MPHFSKDKTLIIILATLVVLGGVFYFWQKRVPELVGPVYGEVYRLVDDKISQSAAIVLNLPEGVNREDAKKNIKFYPEIKGNWVDENQKESVFRSILPKANIVKASSNKETIVFKPKEKLKLNRYYKVELAISNGIVAADFLAVEDPEIIAVFPSENSETNEKSEITIVFNRPMVPLTTLGYLEEKEVPVEIVPQTDGRFKWITTRNLQFIPKERLQRSSHYTVKIKPELVSMDGLEVKGQERKFITRPLRYLNLSSGETVYNQPISIYFNQPVDLERTKKEIILRNTATQEEIDFIVQYAGGKSEKIREEIWGFEGMKNFLASIGSNLFAQISQKETEKNNEEKEEIKKEKIGNLPCGVIFDTQNKIWLIFVHKLLYDFDIAKNKLVNEIEKGDEKLIKNFDKIAKVINLENFKIC